MNGWQGDSGAIVASSEDGVATIRLNRPERLNALVEPMLVELADAITHFDRDEASGGIVLTGTGTAFSAGQDLDAASAIGEDEIEHALDRFNEITRVILRTSVPVAAAINGIAVGGGAEITLACDLRIAARSSEFYLPESRNGMPIGNGTSYLLPRLVGSHAVRLVVGSERIGAAEAQRIGLFDRVVDDDAVVDTAVALMREWGAPTRSTAQHLRVMRPPMADVEAAMQREVESARQGLLPGLMAQRARTALDARRAQAQALEPS